VPNSPDFAPFGGEAGLAFGLAVVLGFAFTVVAGLALETDFAFDVTFVLAFIVSVSLWHVGLRLAVHPTMISPEKIILEIKVSGNGLHAEW